MKCLQNAALIALLLICLQSRALGFPGFLKVPGEAVFEGSDNSLVTLPTAETEQIEDVQKPAVQEQVKQEPVKQEPIKQEPVKQEPVKQEVSCCGLSSSRAPMSSKFRIHQSAVF